MQQRMATLYSKVTSGIEIEVESAYQPDYSDPLTQKFIHTYQVNISNKSNNTTQLLRRHWFIFDSNGVHREVEGEGVVGQQPILSLGESYSYRSWSQLQTDLGRMHGNFLMLDVETGKKFTVEIPFFELIEPARNN